MVADTEVGAQGKHPALQINQQRRNAVNPLPGGPPVFGLSSNAAWRPAGKTKDRSLHQQRWRERSLKSIPAMPRQARVRPLRPAPHWQSNARIHKDTLPAATGGCARPTAEVTTPFTSINLVHSWNLMDWLAQGIEHPVPEGISGPDAARDKQKICQRDCVGERQRRPR